MKDLSPLAQQLVNVGRNAGAPTSADKERIREVLQQRLAALPEPQSPGEPSPAVSAAPGAPWALIAGATVAVGVIAGIVSLSMTTDKDAPPPARPESSGAPVSVAAPPAPAPRSEAPPVPASTAVATEPAAPAPTVKGSSETRSKNRLAEEVALLSRATSALHAGRAQEALRALAEHQRKFPRGSLTVERVAARAQALCQLGRKVEAERELARLSPTSPQAVRARRACGGE